MKHNDILLFLYENRKDIFSFQIYDNFVKNWIKYISNQYNDLVKSQKILNYKS